MNILVLGGTGAMGVPLVNILSEHHTVYVTSRKKRISTNQVRYILGNAKDFSFLTEILTQRYWDAVVDFMVWGKEFEPVVSLLLKNTKQYVFISSARVYAKSDVPITEDTPRLLDVSDDQAFLKTNEYSLTKAREEDVLFHSGYSNYTIIRPSITYNDYRLQLGVLEKENWLYRVLHGRTIVFSEDISDKLTTMTLGNDVASGIASIIGQESALGRKFHVTFEQSVSWREILNIYLEVLEKTTGVRPKYVMVPQSQTLQFKERVYQVKYCRYFNRTFDNKSIAQFCNVSLFTPPRKGLADCLERFLINPRFRDIDWAIEGISDRASNEKTPLSEISSLGGKLDYIAYRYNLSILKKTNRHLRSIVHTLKKL